MQWPGLRALQGEGRGAVRISYHLREPEVLREEEYSALKKEKKAKQSRRALTLFSICDLGPANSLYSIPP